MTCGCSVPWEVERAHDCGFELLIPCCSLLGAPASGQDDEARSRAPGFLSVYSIFINSIF